MTSPTSPPPLDDSDRIPALQNVGVGCLTTVAGFFSGGMIAVFVGKIVGLAQRCVPEAGLPACNWWVYAGVGGVLGAITLPVLALRRLNRGRSDP